MIELHYVPRETSALSFHGRMLLWSLRHWAVAARGDREAPACVWTTLAKVWGTPAAVGPVRRLWRTLAIGARQPIVVRAPCAVSRRACTIERRRRRRCRRFDARAQPVTACRAGAAHTTLAVHVAGALEISPLAELLHNVRVLPVLTVASPEAALPLVDALVRGGVAGIEITLRTPGSAAAIGAVRQTFANLTIGAGTVLDAAGLDAAAKAGASFVVSPGLTEALVREAATRRLPLLPGVATPSEVMRGRDLGLDCFKLFPSKALNGLSLLRSLAEPFPDIRFCPTGGISDADCADYLALPNVACVAGSWLAPSPLIEARAWDEIVHVVRRTLALCRAPESGR